MQELTTATMLATLCWKAMLTTSLLAWILNGSVQADSTTITDVYLQVREQRQVPSPVAGVIASMRVDRGQRVKQGEVIATIDDREQRIARDHAELELRVAEQHAASLANKVSLKQQFLKFAREASSRAQQSNRTATRSVSEEEVARLLLAEQNALFELAEAQHEHEMAISLADLKRNDLDAAEHAVQQRTVVAPMTGEIVDIRVRESEWIELGLPLIRMLRTDPLMIEAFAPSHVSSSLRSGQSVTCQLDMPGLSAASFVGTIDFVSPEVGAVDGNVLFRVRVDNQDHRLLPGCRVRMQLDLSRSTPTQHVE